MQSGPLSEVAGVATGALVVTPGPRTGVGAPGDAGAAPPLTRWLRAWALFGLAGASLGMVVWTVTHRALLTQYVQHNAVERGARLTLLAWMAGAAAVPVLGSMLAGVIARPRRAIRGVERWSRRLCPAIVAGPIALLLHWRAWGGQDLAFLGVTTAVVLGLGPLMETALATAQHEPWCPRWLRGWRWHDAPWLLALGSATFFGVFFGYYTLHNHYNFCTSAFDLGIEHNVVYNTMFEGKFLRTTPLGGNFSHAGYHQTYFTYVIGLVYLLWPHPETLLILQAGFVAAAVIPLFLIARRLVGPGVAATLAVAYSLYAPAQGGVMYDFHYQPFSVFFIPLVCYLFMTRRNVGLVLAVALHLSLREDMGVPLGVLALFFALTGQRPRVALAILAVSLAHFIAFKFVIMPRHLGGEAAYTSMFSKLVAADVGGMAGVLVTIVGNPGYLLQTLLAADRLEYVLLVFAPLAFLPLRRASGWLLLIPGVMFTLFTTGVTASLMISFQYTALWTPFVFIGTAWALAAVEGPSRLVQRRRRAAWLVALMAGMVITTVRHGYLFQDETTLGAFDPVHFGSTAQDRQNRADFRALVAHIGPKDKVVASEWLVSHLSARPDAYTLRFGTFDAEWLVFWHDVRRDELPHVERALREATFGVVERRGKFVLARRGHDPAQNGKVLQWLRAPLPRVERIRKVTR